MKKILLSAAALGLAFGLASAQAAPNDRHDDKAKTQDTHKEAPKADSNAHHMTGGAMTGPQGGHMTGPQGDKSRMDSGRNTMMGPQGGHMTGPQGDKSKMDSGRNTMMGPQSGHMNTGRHEKADITRYRGNVHAERHFRFGTYHGPRDYHYRRWTFGERLPAIYFARSYWLSGYLNFGLMPPPYGCVWVRFGPDALLVDTETGEIIRVVYGIFY